MQIAVFAYDHATALDIVGPSEFLSRIPGADVVVVGEARGPVRCDPGHVAVVVDASLDDVTTPDVLIVPGWSGATQEHLRTPGPFQEWVRAADRRTTWTASVGTGAILLAAAGLLAERRAVTHWLAVDWLEALGARPVDQPVVIDGKYMTAAGTSAGIELGLRLAAEVAGEQTARALQLLLAYDPRPPYGGGSVATAPAPMVRAMRSLRHFILTGTPTPATVPPPANSDSNR
jgi:putative intracellular protease/amidase